MSTARIIPMRPISVLLVEDDASDAYLVQNGLNGVYPGEFGVVHTCSLEEALPPLGAWHFDVALLDLSLPGSSDIEALTNLRHRAPKLPVVILTGHDNEDLALMAIKHGAQDYLVKEHADGHLVKRAIRYAIERKHVEDNLTMLANYDGLTGLANRSLFESRVEMALMRARRIHEKFAVFFLDLDLFKSINDRLGHDSGDALLKGVATRLALCLRECDMVARFGGDEFAILLEGAVQPRSCAIVAQKIIDALKARFILDGKEIAIDISIGIVVARPEETFETVLKHADAAMYRAKAIGGSNYQFYTEHMHRETVTRLKLEQDLTMAIRNRQPLCLYYQPRIDTVSGMMVGAEALIRWDHPSNGLMLAADFLPFLSPKLTLELDLWVLEMVCRDIRSWRAAGLESGQISVHLSNRQWHDQATLDGLLAVVEKAGLPTRCLALEMDESTIRHYDGNLNIVSHLRDTGFDIHLDNFGVDVASLKLLAHCPLAAIRIDRSLIHAIGQKAQHNALIGALVSLAHQFGMKVVAEGVETHEQKAALAAMNCDQIQGFIISRPLAAEDFFNWMANRHDQAA